MDNVYYIAFICCFIGVTEISAQEEAKHMLPPKCAAWLLCPAPPCVDHYTPRGECCPVCRDEKSCYYKGKVYKDGESFKDECNRCHCRNGVVACTKMACPDKPGVCPKPWRFSAGICVEMCSSDSGCPGKQKCCSNGCGHVCRIPKDILTGCYVNGIRYNEGDRVPRKLSDPCQTCFCRSGSVECEMMMCPMCVGHTPPGVCCPICGSFPLE